MSAEVLKSAGETRIWVPFSRTLTCVFVSARCLTMASCGFVTLKATIDERLLATIDAIVSLGPTAIQALESFVVDAPAKDPTRGFAAALVHGSIDGRDGLAAAERALAHLGAGVAENVEAFGEGKVPRFLIRDRDGLYGLTFQDRVKALGIEEVVIAPRSPWQNPYSERVIGSLRRECLDYVVVLGEKHLRRIMRHCLSYYNPASYCLTSLCV